VTSEAKKLAQVAKRPIAGDHGEGQRYSNNRRPKTAMKNVRTAMKKPKARQAGLLAGGKLTSAEAAVYQSR